MKKIFLACLLFGAVTALHAQTTEELVYLHADRDVYAPLDQINFKAYVQSVKSAEFNSSTKLFILLLNQDGKVVADKDFEAKDKQCAGTLNLPDTLSDGEYRLLAYTSEMEKGLTKNVFSRKVFIRKGGFHDLFITMETDAKWYVQGEFAQIKVHITLVDGKPYINDQLMYLASKNGSIYQNGLGKTDENGDALLTVRIPATGQEGVLILAVQAESGKLRGSAAIQIPGGGMPVFLNFYPEGGSLIDGLETKVAFRAMDFQGLPFDFSGVIIDQHQQVVDSIKSMSFGIGSFTIKPSAKDSLRVKITKPAGMIREIPLPRVQATGVQLKLKERKEGFLTFQVINKGPVQLQGLGIASGKNNDFLRFDENPDLLEADSTFSIAANKLSGTICISLQNSAGRIFSQRSVFINPPVSRILSSDGTGKSKSKDPNSLIFTVSDQTGNPMDASVSISVVDAVMSPDWNREPDLRSWFLLGPTASAIPPGYLSDLTNLNENLIDNLMLSKVDTTNNKLTTTQDFRSRLIKYHQPKPFDKLAATFHRDRFFNEYFVSAKNDFPSYIKANKSQLQELGFLPGKPTQEDRIRQQLEIGLPVLNVIKSIKPYTLTDNQIYFAKGKNSLQYPKGALIIIDGAEKGCNVEVLNTISPYDIASIKVSDKISDILKYSGDASGLIVITTKKATGATEAAEKFPERLYNPTRYWNAELKISGSGVVPLVLPKSEIKSTWQVVIQGIDSKGTFVEAVLYR